MSRMILTAIPSAIKYCIDALFIHRALLLSLPALALPAERATAGEDNRWLEAPSLPFTKYLVGASADVWTEAVMPVHDGRGGGDARIHRAH